MNVITPYHRARAIWTRPVPSTPVRCAAPDLLGSGLVQASQAPKTELPKPGDSELVEEPPVSGPLAFRMQVREDDSLGDDQSRSAKSWMNDIV